MNAAVRTHLVQTIEGDFLLKPSLNLPLKCYLDSLAHVGKLVAVSSSPGLEALAFSCLLAFCDPQVCR